jgi:biopolymer transport protein ExbD
VDVVMVILIFLMLAGSFGGATHYLMSKASIKTKGAGGAKLPPDTVPDVDLDLQVANNENGASLGFVARINGMDATNDSDKLAEELTTKFKNFLAAGNNRDTLEVVIHPAKNVRYEYLVQVYQAALQAQFPKVAFATSS